MDLNLDQIQKIVLDRIEQFHNMVATNPCYNAKYAQEDLMTLIHELEKTYSVHIDAFSYKVSATRG